MHGWGCGSTNREVARQEYGFMVNSAFAFASLAPVGDGSALGSLKIAGSWKDFRGIGLEDILTGSCIDILERNSAT